MITAPTMSNRPNTPPTTPPMIAPLLDFFLGLAVAVGVTEAAVADELGTAVDGGGGV
jgi:hypothetical protein